MSGPRPRTVDGWPVEPGSRDVPLIIAHRGWSSGAPENTLESFQLALELGADGMELDVRLTKDRRIVVMHDRRVDRTTSGRGPVGTLTLAQLQSLDAGFLESSDDLFQDQRHHEGAGKSAGQRRFGQDLDVAQVQGLAGDIGQERDIHVPPGAKKEKLTFKQEAAIGDVIA